MCVRDRCTTMGLCGFSSYDASFGHFNSPMIEWVAIVFMTLAGISFVRYFVVLRSRSILPISSDREIRTYLAVLLAAPLLVMGLLFVHGVYVDGLVALRISAFHLVSLATTTGSVSFTLLRSHDTVLDLVCRLLVVKPTNIPMCSHAR